MTASMSSRVMATAYRASSCSISMMSAIRSWSTAIPLLRTSVVEAVDDVHRWALRHRLAGEDPALVDLVVVQRVVGAHRRLAAHQLRHAGGAVTVLAGGRRLQPRLPGG